MQEIWKDIPKYENLYQVNIFGDIKSIAKNRRCGWKEKYLKKTPIKNQGYLTVTLYNPKLHKGPKRVKVCKCVASAFLGEANGRQVNHIDHNRQNDQLNNLEYISAIDNTIIAFLRKIIKNNPNTYNTYINNLVEKAKSSLDK